jgi:hypothetical protein
VSGNQNSMSSGTLGTTTVSGNQNSMSSGTLGTTTVSGNQNSMALALPVAIIQSSTWFEPEPPRCPGIRTV